MDGAGRKIILYDNGTWAVVRQPTIQDRQLEYIDSSVHVIFKSITQLHFRQSPSFQVTDIEFSVKNIKINKFIDFKTRKQSCNEHTDECSYYIIGFYVRDNFNNDYAIAFNGLKVDGGTSSTRQHALRPGETKTLTLTINNYPLESASHVELHIDKGTLGNNKKFVLKIPVNAIKKQHFK